MNVLSNVFVSFGKHMTNNKTISLLEFTKLLGFRIEMLWLKFLDGQLGKIDRHEMSMLFQ